MHHCRAGPVALPSSASRGEAGKLTIEGGDLGPVARLARMQGRDRRLQNVRTTAVQRQSSVEDRQTIGDLSCVPERAVLVGEQDQVATPKPRPAAGVVQQHHRQQTVDLRFVGHQLGEGARCVPRSPR